VRTRAEDGAEERVPMPGPAARRSASRRSAPTTRRQVRAQAPARRRSTTGNEIDVAEVKPA
jgi:hypothetical protein